MSFDIQLYASAQEERVATLSGLYSWRCTLNGLSMRCSLCASTLVTEH